MTTCDGANASTYGYACANAYTHANTSTYTSTGYACTGYA